MKNYTFRLYFNCADAGTIIEKDFETALRSAMFQLDVKGLHFAEIFCDELQSRMEYHYPYLNEENHLICEAKYGFPTKTAYNKPDGLKVWNRGRAQCDHSGLMKHRTCFRPVHTTYYADDALGWATPVLQMCRVHSGTDATEVGYHE